MDLITYRGDTLEFDVDIKEANGAPFELREDDKYWFAVKKEIKDVSPIIYIEHTNEHFKIDLSKYDKLQCGTYHYELGILFTDKTEKTVIQGQLYVNHKVKGCKYD